MTNLSDTDEPPRRRQVRLQFPPRKSEVFWCDFPPSACLHQPEFWKRRTVVIISRRTTLSGVTTVVPMTSSGQQNPALAVAVRSPIDGRNAWVICNHATTVAVSRLLPVHSNGSQSVSQQEYKAILRKVIENLATP